MHKTRLGRPAQLLLLLSLVIRYVIYTASGLNEKTIYLAPMLYLQCYTQLTIKIISYTKR